MMSGGYIRNTGWVLLFDMGRLHEIAALAETPVVFRNYRGHHMVRIERDGLGAKPAQS